MRRRLLRWYARHKRTLPWRGTRNPYRIWLSEVMLQQTRVEVVRGYYRRFLQRFPSVAALARAREEEVLRLWAGLGYYRRARNLHAGAKTIVREQGGRFPRTYEAVRALPGVGDYTAAAVTSIAFAAPRAVLDGNVARVLARLGAVRGDLRRPATWRRLQHRADEMLAERAPGDWNQALMELGATVCTPRGPRCGACPLTAGCRARQRGIVDRVPKVRRQRAPQEVWLAALVFLDPQGRTLLVRTDDEHFSRLWHFPVAQARGARARAVFSVAHGATEPAAPVRHAVTFRQVTITPLVARVPWLPQVAGATVVPLAGLGTVPVSSATRKVAAAACGLLEKKEGARRASA
jgi:A/G-specific adenine glycosylase